MIRNIIIAVLLLFLAYTHLQPEPFDVSKVTISRAEYTRLLIASDSLPYYKSWYERNKVVQTLHVEATAYNATKAQCGNAKGITATGTRVKEGRTVAVSRSLKHLLGKTVELHDGGHALGVFVVEDLMAESVKGHRVDIYLKKEPDADGFGKRRLTMKVLKT